MRRIMVIGAPGTGKSTLSRTIAASLGLPVVHLDQLTWLPGWEAQPREPWRQAIAAQVAGEAWVLDGHYASAWDISLPRAEAVVWLDLPRRVYFTRCLARIARYRGTVRPDMAEGCPERFDRAFLTGYVWTFHARNRPRILATIDHLRASRPVVVLRSRGEVSQFVAGLPRTLTRATAGDRWDPIKTIATE